MSRPDKTAEASMEEILASIRKIIAEEPIGTRPGPEERAPADQRTTRQKAAAFGPSQSSTQSGRPALADAVGIDEVLDLAGSLGFDMPSAKDIASHKNGVDRAHGLAKPIAAKEPAQTPASGPGSQAQPATRPEGQRNDARLMFSPLQRDFNGKSGDLGGVGPNSAPALSDTSDRSTARPNADALLSEARAKVERHLSSPAAVDGADRPSALGLKSIRDFGDGKEPSDSDAGHKPVLGGLVARVAAAGSRAEAPAGEKFGPPAPSGPARSAQLNTGASAATAAPSDGQAAASIDGDRTRSPIAASMVAETTHGAVKSAEAGGSESAAPPGDSGVQAGAGQATRGLEEAVAAMLRPMLREWLDANLPRIVQQVLREEMAKSPMAGKDSGPSS